MSTEAPAHSTLAEALVAAQAEMPAVEKDARNPHFDSKFTSLDHLIAKTRPVLNKHGLAIKQSPTVLDGLPALATTVLHTSGERETDVMLLLVGKNDMQGLGSAITYGKRYMWAAALGVSTEDDDDGNTSAVQSSAPEPELFVGAAHDFVVSFGKHKGKTLGQVHDEDPQYVDWLSREGRQDIKPIALALLNARSEDLDPDAIPF